MRWDSAEICLTADEARLIQLCLDGTGAIRITIRRKDERFYAFCGDQCGEYQSTGYKALKNLYHEVEREG